MGNAEDPDPENERELTVIELMNGPGRPSDSARHAVLWLSFAFAFALLALTIGLIVTSGFDLLSFLTLVILGFVNAAMIGALRHKGEDPMAQFEPPPIPKRRLGARRRRDADAERRARTKHDDEGARPDVVLKD
ncbi:MAG: hypothetical protein WAO61_03145 [Solirubrobacterales bacterium]